MYSPYMNEMRGTAGPTNEEIMHQRIKQLEAEIELLNLKNDNFEERVEQAYDEIEKEFKKQHTQLLLTMEHYQRHFGEIRRVFDGWMYSMEYNKEEFISKMKILMYGN